MPSFFYSEMIFYLMRLFKFTGLAPITLDTAAIYPGLLFSLFGPRRAFRIRLAVRFGLDAFLAFFFTFSHTVAAFALALARRVSCWHFFHDIVLLFLDLFVRVNIVASDNVTYTLCIICEKSSYWLTGHYFLIFDRSCLVFW